MAKLCAVVVFPEPDGPRNNICDLVSGNRNIV